jgi:hypothetical protein
MRPVQSSLSRGFVDATGKFTVTDESRKPYVLRTGKGLSPAHAKLNSIHAEEV